MTNEAEYEAEYEAFAPCRAQFWSPKSSDPAHSAT